LRYNKLMNNLRMSEDELHKLVNEYKRTKDKKPSVRINCLIAWAKGWDWATIEDILMVSNAFIGDTIRKV